MPKAKAPVPFQQIIAALLDDTRPFPARYIYRFSDLTADELSLLEKNWAQVPLRRRQAVMEDVEEFNNDFVLNFFEIAHLAVRDPDALIRLLAIRTLAEYDSTELVQLFIDAAERDNDVPVRSAATSALGNLVQQGELEELPAAALRQVEECLLRIYNSQDAKIIRLRALESLGYSSREEVPGLIETAYQSNDTEWLTAALVAMGRSYNKNWRGDVLAALSDPRSTVRIEAITAAGELELTDATSTLMDAVRDEDSAVRQAAIWALSQIGGEDVRETLEQMLDETEDEEEEDLLEAALENLEFTEGLTNFAMLDLDEEDLDDFDIFDEDEFEGD